MSREELLAELNRAFAELERAIDGLSHEQMLQRWYGEGGEEWSIRDILAHITGWHHEMDDVLERIARGEKPIPEGVDYNDSDAWNARFVETWSGASPEAMVAEVAFSRDLFVSAAKRVPEEKYVEGKTAYRILTGTGTNHYRVHAPDIRAWRERENI